jgi:hypothetical protein
MDDAGVVLTRAETEHEWRDIIDRELQVSDDQHSFFR